MISRATAARRGTHSPMCSTPLSKLQAILGALSFLAIVPVALRAQAPLPITVEDASGAAITGAVITGADNRQLGRTSTSGMLAIDCSMPCRITVSATGFASQTLTIAAPLTIRLQPVSAAESVTITAYRAPLGDLESPATTRVLTARTLSATPAITLDDQLRQLPGVELFRRSPSLVANPTSQGISLRGLGSTSASRTLVTEDDVPLNDPLGGWIHWQEQPALSIHDIELVRGGASDLYGSSAIGGVINIVPTQPSSQGLEVRSTYGGEGTYDTNGLAQTKMGPWGMLAAAGMLGTDGYIQESPDQRGPVDQPSNVHSQSALLIADRAQGPLRLFARVNAFNELRHNGTPYQFNATRLFRYSTGVDWSAPRSAALTLRLYGSDERYRQTFSSLSNLPDPASPACSYRCGENPSKYSYVPTNELGESVRYSQPLRAGLLFLAGADSRDIRIWDREQSFATISNPNATITNLHDHQRDVGAYAELMATIHAWTVIASARFDSYRNFDGEQVKLTGTTWGPPTAQPEQSQVIFDPRLGLSRKLGEHWALSASGFRAFREPTPNELYRTTQVGSQVTSPNNTLLSERATGWEAGLASERSRGAVRVSYFLTQVNRPIVALTTGSNTYMRENLGQIESRGLSLDYELSPLRWLTLDGGYQYAHAVVSRGAIDNGKWIPEVARNLATLNLRASRPRVGTLSLESRLSGRMYDDDVNTFLLAGYFRIDAYAAHSFHSRPFGSQIELFAAADNLTGQSIEVSKTPTTTLGQPRVARVGFTLRLGPSAQ